MYKDRFFLNIKSVAALIVFTAFGLQMLSIPFLNYFSFALISSAVFGCCLLYGVSHRNLVALFSLAFGLFCYMFVSSLITDTIGLGIYVSIIASIILSIIMLNYDDDSIMLKTLYYFLFVFLVLVCFALISGVNPDKLWPQSSRNTTSEVFVVLGAIFLISGRVLPSLKFKPLFYSLIVIVSIMSIGRSGIITSLILFAAFSLYNFSASRRRKLFYLFPIAIVPILYFREKVFFYFEYLEQKGLTDSYRLNMIKEFFDNYNSSVFMFGVDFSTLPYIAAFNSNPHNAFIGLHGALGFVAIILFIGLLLSLVRFALNGRYVALIALIAMLLRLSTDEASGLILLPIVYVSVDGIDYFLKSAFKKNRLTTT